MGTKFKNKGMNRSDKILVRCLLQNPRMGFTEMSRKTGVAASTLHDAFKRMKPRLKFSCVFVPKEGDE